MKPAPALAILTSLLVACSAAQPSPSVEGGASSTAPTRSPIPTATPRPTAAPTESPIATAISFEWGEPTEMTGLGGHWPDRPRLAHADGTYVLMEGSQVWTSGDTTAWSEADLPFGSDDFIELNGLVAGGPGFVIVGTETIDTDTDGDADDSAGLVLTSVDGRAWERLTDSRFAHSGINHLGSSRQGLVAFGSTRDAGASMWTSADGDAWLKATNETGLEVARGVQLVAEHEGRLTAFVGHPGPTGIDFGEVEIWQTEGRADWEKVGSLPETSAYVLKAAFGAGRWLATGAAPDDDDVESGPNAWTSTDGRVWTRTIVPDEAHGAIAGWAEGMVLVSHTGPSPGETCGGSGPFVGTSRISLSGGDWLAVPPTLGVAASGLLVVDDTLLAVGLSARGDGGAVPVRWLAALPRSVTVPAPTPTPAPTPASEGCGG